MLCGINGITYDWGLCTIAVCAPIPSGTLWNGHVATYQQLWYKVGNDPVTVTARRAMEYSIKIVRCVKTGTET